MILMTSWWWLVSVGGRVVDVLPLYDCRWQLGVAGVHQLVWYLTVA